MTDYLRFMPEYFEAVRARIMKGAILYENRSFSARPEELIEELKQEAQDLAGWGYVLFCRLQAMQDALEGSSKVSDAELASKQPKTHSEPLAARAADPRETRGKRIGGILGAMRKTIEVHETLLENLIGEICGPRSAKSRGYGADASKQPILTSGATVESKRMVGAERHSL